MDEEEKTNEPAEKGIAMEILGELKRQNERLIEINKQQDERISEINKSHSRTITKFVILVGVLIVGFLAYLWQYDFSGTIEQNGVYALVDSDGNVIGSDITPEQMEDILRILNGKSESK